MSYEKFEVLELIGRGSFGNVRKVRRLSDGRLCVRKEISYIKMNPKERSQLIDEFRILGSLSHPNIVEYIYHEHVPEDHMVYLYMEYCDGGDLSQVIKSHKKNQEYVAEDLVWSIFTQMVMALYRCHYGVDPPALRNLFQADYESVDEVESSKTPYKYSVNGNSEPNEVNNESVVIHRDIKPDNVFLLKDNRVKLGDFGLAKLLVNDSDFATTYVGTPYYMSPEVLSDKPYTPLSDIWSLGCVIYELCSLHPPFQAKTHLQLQTRIKEGNFPKIPNHYSQKLRMTINACITVDANQRPSTYLLLQEVSIKIFRKELELNSRELKLRQESQKLEEIRQKLVYQSEVLDNKKEELMFLQNQMNTKIDKEVHNRVMMLFNEREFMEQFISQVTNSSSGAIGGIGAAAAGAAGSAIPDNSKILKPSNSNPQISSKYKKLMNDENFLQLSNPNAYGGNLGQQNLNMNGLNCLNKNIHSNNSHILKKKKNYYNELYEDNTSSPFLKTFNSDF